MIRQKSARFPNEGVYALSFGSSSSACRKPRLARGDISSSGTGPSGALPLLHFRPLFRLSSPLPLLALGVLRVGTNEEHRAALQSVALTQLSTPADAQLWACLLEAAGRGVQGVEEYATAVTGAASTIASAQFASSLGL